jgi:hypothetical protein
MTVNPPPSKWTPPPSAPEAKPVIHRTITLRVDLRVLAALGGTLIIVGSFLPWVAPQFQPVVRVFGPATSGSWPILLFGVLAIVLQFWPQLRTPRVSLPAAALGFAAGAIALASALSTIGVGRTLIGEQTISPLTGVGIGVYLTLAGSLIAVLAGLAPLPPHHEPARAELRLWKASTAILGTIVVLFGLVAVLFGSWIGSGGAGRGGTPTPSAIDAGLLVTPFINVQVDPLSTPETAPSAEFVSTPTIEIPIDVTPTPLVSAESTDVSPATPTDNPTLIPTRIPPTPTLALTETPTPTPPASSTQQQSPIDTPTPTATPTPTPTAGS